MHPAAPRSRPTKWEYAVAYRSMRICFFGDSFVNGTGDDDALGWVGRAVASARRAGRDVTAYNLGVRGDTSADIAARWEREARLRLPPGNDGRLVFSFGANDGASDGADARVPYQASIANAEAILQSALRWLPTLMIGPAIIADDPAANARIRAVSTGYAQLCARLGVPYLEIVELLSASAIWTREAMAGDGAHPSRGGYGLVADAVCAWSAWQVWTVPRGRILVPA
jgi:acyl-CoA thioesterase-1